MDESVVIDPSGDTSGDFSQVVAVFGDGDGDAGVVVSKKSKTYVCHFCGRECRNAQALGGHMNVHRRERLLAKQLVELRNEQGEQGQKLKKTKTNAAATCGLVAASGSLAVGKDEWDHQEEEVIAYGGSSASSSSPPSPQSIAIASALVHPWRSLQRLPSTNRKSREALDLELRLGFTPTKFF